MSKVELDEVQSGYNLSKINSNFQKIEEELNNKVLYRQIQGGEPNAMSENIDMNSNDILNAGGVYTNKLVLKGKEVSQEDLVVVGPFDPASFTFSTGGTLNVGDNTVGVLWPSPSGGDGQFYLWKGSYPKIVPALSTPATTGGVSTSGWLPLGDITLRAELSSNATPGSNLVGMPNGTLTQYLASQRGIDPRLPPYNYKDSDSLAARTASLNAAFSDANVSKRGIYLAGAFSVSPISLVGHTDYTIFGSATITIIGGTGAGFEIKNCTGLKTSGSILIIGHAGLQCGVKVWGSGGTYPNFTTCSLHNLEFSVTNCDLAWQFGDYSAPDNLLSEIVIRSGYTYNCRQVFMAIGSQTVIEFNGYQMIATNGTVGSSLPSVGICVGAYVHINGGEVILPDVTTGWGFTLMPLDSPNYDNRYGECYINGSAMEIASLWLYAYNPASVTGIVAGSGKFVLDNCSGFANFSGDNLQSDASFTGSVIVRDTCAFHRTAPKPANTFIGGLLGAAKIKIADSAFDSNFNTGLQAFRPSSQIPQYGHRKIFTASNLAGQTFTQSVATDMKFSLVVSTGENAFYASNYNTSTGVFTVPAGGLKSVKVLLEFNAIALRANSEISLLVDGVSVAGWCGIPNKYVSQMFDVGDLSAGQTIRFRLTNLDTTFSVGSVATDRFVISARTE